MINLWAHLDSDEEDDRKKKEDIFADEDCTIKCRDLMKCRDFICVVYGYTGKRIEYVKNVARDPAIDQGKQFEEICQDLWNEWRPHYILWDLKLPDNLSFGEPSSLVFMTMYSGPMILHESHASGCDLLYKKLEGVHRKVTVDDESELTYSTLLEKLQKA